MEELTDMALKNFTVHVNCTDLAGFRHLTSKDCLIVTDEDLMRGVDY